MNKNSQKEKYFHIFVVNEGSQSNDLSTISYQLQRHLPHCPIAKISTHPDKTDFKQFPQNSVFLVLNTDDRNSELQNFIHTCEVNCMKYVMYPHSVPGCHGPKASTMNELTSHLSQMLLQSSHSISQESVSTIKRIQKSNVFLNVIIAKSQNKQFRHSIKSIYKKYKQNPKIDFFQSQTLEKIHTALFKKVLFLIHQSDIPKYKVGYDIFKSKKAPEGKLTTVVFTKKPKVYYQFQYDSEVSSGEQFQHLIIRSLQNSSADLFYPRSSSQPRGQSFTQSVRGAIGCTNFQQNPYQYMYDGKINPSSSNQQLIINSKLNRNSCQNYPTQQVQRISQTGIENYKMMESNKFLSNNNINNQSKDSQNLLQYTITQNNQLSAESFGDSVPMIRTTEIILKETKDNMNKLYKHYLSEEQKVQQQPTSIANKRDLEIRKPSISVMHSENQNSQNQYTSTNNASAKLCQQKPQSIEGCQNFKRKNQDYANFENSNTNILVEEKGRQSVSHNVNMQPQNRLYRQGQNNNLERRSLMRNTPQRIHNTQQRNSQSRRISSGKQNIYESSVMNHKFSSNLKLGQVSKINSQYYSGITSGQRSSMMMNSPQRSISRPKSSRYAGKLSVIQCLGNTCSKTLSQMLQKQSRILKQQSQVDELQFGDKQQSLQLIFSVNSPYIQHLSRYFEAYPCQVFKYKDNTQLIDILSVLERSCPTLLVISNQILESTRLFKSFSHFNHIITSRQQNIAKLKHKFPGCVILRQENHSKSFRQLLNYIRLLKFKDHQKAISDKQMIPHLSKIQGVKMYIPHQPEIQRFISNNLRGFEVITYLTIHELVEELEGDLNKNNSRIEKVLILRDAEPSLVQHLLSSVFNIKKVLVYNQQKDIPQLQSEILKIVV